MRLRFDDHFEVFAQGRSFAVVLPVEFIHLFSKFLYLDAQWIEDLLEVFLVGRGKLFGLGFEHLVGEIFELFPESLFALFQLVRLLGQTFFQMFVSGTGFGQGCLGFQ